MNSARPADPIHCVGPSPEPRGFTLIELMVAIAITSILILFISQVFNTVQGTVSYGIRVADVLDHQRVVSDQIVRDTAEMLGPSDNGFLIVVNHVVPAYYSAEHEQGAKEAQLKRPPFIRSDQLVFIRSRGELDPICPDRSTRFDGQSEAQFVRIWYGHGVRPRPDGLLTGGGPNLAPPGGRAANFGYTVGATLQDGINRGQPSFGNLGGKDAGRGAPVPGTNYYCANWILGRQALFLDPTITSGTASGRIFANDAISVSPVNGVVGKPGGLTSQLWSGLTDIAAVSTAQVHERIFSMKFDPKASNPTATPGSISWEGALRLTYSDNRLIVNPEIRPTWSGATGDIQAWQVAQQHALLMPNVSEFAIDFSADINNNDMLDYIDERKVAEFQKNPESINTLTQATWRNEWLMDRTTNSVPANNANNPNAKQDNLDDRYRLSRTVWYSYFASREPLVFGSVVDPTSQTRAGAIFQGYGAFRDINRDNALRDRYPNASGIFVWHRNKPRQWPHMLRIRYRLHDSSGQLSDSTGEPGRTFEQIIRVRR
jgi:prepilin-type N-terminal cleavage/methylation domain-containing protein